MFAPSRKKTFRVCQKQKKSMQPGGKKNIIVEFYKIIWKEFLLPPEKKRLPEPKHKYEFLLFLTLFFQFLIEKSKKLEKQKRIDFFMKKSKHLGFQNLSTSMNFCCF